LGAWEDIDAQRKIASSNGASLLKKISAIITLSRKRGTLFYFFSRTDNRLAVSFKTLRGLFTNMSES